MASHKHPSDVKPTSKLEATKLYELRVASAIVERPAVFADGSGEHPGLRTDAMRPMARSKRGSVADGDTISADGDMPLASIEIFVTVPAVEPRPRAKRPSRDAIRMEALDPYWTTGAEDDERRTTEMTPTARASKPTVCFDPRALFGPSR